VVKVGVGVQNIFNRQSGRLDLGQNPLGFVAGVDYDALPGFFTANDIAIGSNRPNG
jgi:hypothetical protein